MFCEEIEDEYRVTEKCSSDGQQNKYCKNGIWYKENTLGNEGIAEEIASVFLSCSSLAPDEYVIYEAGTANHSNGCRSRNFLQYGESFITLYRFYILLTGEKLDELIQKMDTPEERADHVLNFFAKNSGLDLTDYFRKIFTTDLVTLNEDRHLNNLGLIEQADGTYRPAPIFDNGHSMFIGNYSVKPDLPIEENRKRITAKPFSSSCDRQYSMFPNGFGIDFTECRKRLHMLPAAITKSDPFRIMLQNMEYVQMNMPELKWNKRK